MLTSFMVTMWAIPNFVHTYFSVSLDLKTICDELTSVTSKSCQIGVHLGVPVDKLKLFEKDTDPLSSVITYWLCEGVAISWMSLVDALESVDEKGLAEIIRKKYCDVPEIGECNSSI